MCRNWPIARSEAGDFLLLGLPQCLGSGELPTRESCDRFPPLEAVAGADWLMCLLSVLLPRSLAWAWWAPSRAISLARLSPGAMPAAVPLRSLNRVVARSWFWRGVSLALVPPTRADAQSLVLEWAGVDTEHTPQFLLTAPAVLEVWDSEVIADWCRSRSAWGNPGSLASLPTERVITLFDGDVYAAIPASIAASALRAVSDLAGRWGLQVISGPVELAWPTPGKWH